MRQKGKRIAMVLIVTATAIVLFSLALLPEAVPVTVAAQSTSTRIAGKPDLSGIWQANNTAYWDLQTHTSRPMVPHPGITPNSTVLGAPVLALGALGWIPAGVGVVEGEEIPYLPWA